MPHAAPLVLAAIVANSALLVLAPGGPQILGRRVRARGQARAAPTLVPRRLPEWGRMRVAPALVPQRLPEWGRKTPPPAQIRAPTIN